MDKFEVKLNEIEDKVHEVDKQVSNVNIKLDSAIKDHVEINEKIDRCFTGCGERITNLESTVNGMWSKVIFALIAVIAAITGADAAMQGFGHTPILSHIGYYSTVFAIIMAAMGMLYLALRRNGYSYMAIIASILVLISGFATIQEGFTQPGQVLNLSVGIPLLLAGILCCIEVMRKWLKRI
jgi:hypothetical protein